jgi:hypothetical protein
MCIMYTDAQVTALDYYNSLCYYTVSRVLISSQKPVACCS